jgi:hypothetical protein
MLSWASTGKKKRNFLNFYFIFPLKEKGAKFKKRVFTPGERERKRDMISVFFRH